MSINKKGGWFVVGALVAFVFLVSFFNEFVLSQTVQPQIETVSSSSIFNNVPNTITFTCTACDSSSVLWINVGGSPLTNAFSVQSIWPYTFTAISSGTGNIALSFPGGGVIAPGSYDFFLTSDINTGPSVFHKKVALTINDLAPVITSFSSVPTSPTNNVPNQFTFLGGGITQNTRVDIAYGSDPYVRPSVPIINSFNSASLSFVLPAAQFSVAPGAYRINLANPVGQVSANPQLIAFNQDPTCSQPQIIILSANSIVNNQANIVTISGSFDPSNSIVYSGDSPAFLTPTTFPITITSNLATINFPAETSVGRYYFAVSNSVLDVNCISYAAALDVSEVAPVVSQITGIGVSANQVPVTGGILYVDGSGFYSGSELYFVYENGNRINVEDIGASLVSVNQAGTQMVFDMPDLSSLISLGSAWEFFVRNPGGTDSTPLVSVNFVASSGQPPAAPSDLTATVG